MSLGVTHTVPLQVIPFAVVAELPSNTVNDRNSMLYVGRDKY